MDTSVKNHESFTCLQGPNKVVLNCPERKVLVGQDVDTKSTLQPKELFAFTIFQHQNHNGAIAIRWLNHQGFLRVACRHGTPTSVQETRWSWKANSLLIIFPGTFFTISHLVGASANISLGLPPLKLWLWIWAFPLQTFSRAVPGLPVSDEVNHRGLL